MPGELIAAFLWAQLEEAQAIGDRRQQAWEHYHQGLADAEHGGLLRRPIIPRTAATMPTCTTSCCPTISRAMPLAAFAQHDIGAVFHYVPLHDSPAGRRYARASGELAVTRRQADRLVRLPLWVGISPAQQDEVLALVNETIRRLRGEAIRGPQRRKADRRTR
ncbi:MAG: DegT/DnrJ/EryC1/StrS family aminotransferase [Burkholderiaceae bacterium]